MSRIDEQDKLRLKGADFAGVVFRSGTAFQNEEMSCCCEVFIFKQGARHHQPGGVVSAQVTAHSHQAGLEESDGVIPP